MPADTNKTTHSLNDMEIALPKTATKPIRVPKKRGRKGNKIAIAFKEIPAAAVDFEDFATSHGVTTKTLRQIKRHDSCPEAGKVFVRKNKTTKKMMIWRDANQKPKA